LNRSHGLKKTSAYGMSTFTMTSSPRTGPVWPPVRSPKKRKLGVTFNCIVRIGHIDTDLCRMLKTSGCWMVNVGIESGDQVLLDTSRTGLPLRHPRDVNALYKSGMYVKGLFMMGFPGETEASIIKTREFANSLPSKTPTSPLLRRSPAHYKPQFPRQGPWTTIGRKWTASTLYSCPGEFRRGILAGTV